MYSNAGESYLLYRPISQLKANVTRSSFHNVYVYTAPTLWIAYGLATFVTLIGVIFGLRATLSSNASYSTDFSTIVRATRHADPSVNIHSLDVG